MSLALSLFFFTYSWRFNTGNFSGHSPVTHTKGLFTLQKKMGWVRTHKKVGTDRTFVSRKPSVPYFHEMDPDSLFSGLGAKGGYGPKTEKKKSPDPFCCSKALCKRISVPYHLLHVSLPCFTVVSRLCTTELFNHKPNLILEKLALSPRSAHQSPL